MYGTYLYQIIATMAFKQIRGFPRNNDLGLNNDEVQQLLMFHDFD